MGNGPKLSAKATKPSKMDSQNLAVVKKQNIPVQMTDMSIFDDSYVSMKERFSEEMKQVDQYMFALSKALTSFYNRNLTVQTALTLNASDEQPGWDDITNSPLVDDNGEQTTINLQFDVSQFSPDEIEVKIADNKILVSAVHDAKSDTSSEHREYHRYFTLPYEANPESVISTLSRDGVLTVQVPLQPPETLQEIKGNKLTGK